MNWISIEDMTLRTMRTHRRWLLRTRSGDEPFFYFVHDHDGVRAQFGNWTIGPCHLAALPDSPSADVVPILVPSCPVEGCGLPFGCSLPTCTIDGKTTIHTHTIDLSAPPKLIWAQGLTRSGSAHERFDLLQVGGDMIATAWLGDHGWRWIIVGTMTGDGVGADSYREAMDAVQEALGLLGSQKSEESTPIEPVFARHPIGDTGWFLCVEGFTTSSGRFAATGAPFVVELGGINEGSHVLVGSNLIVSLDSFDVPDNVRRALHGRPLPTWGCATVDWPVGGWPHPGKTDRRLRRQIAPSDAVL